jgi:long-chain acyl-CoA synthetase
MARRTLLSFLDDCLTYGDQTAVRQKSGLRFRSYAYRDLASIAYQFARELESRKINKGERIIIWSANSPEWISIFLGCMLRGVIAVPLDCQSTSDFVARVQRQVSARLLIHGTNQIPGSDINVSTIKIDRLIGAIADRPGNPINPDDVNENHIIEIIFTSGTTSEPKGVCLTHRNLLANLDPIEREVRKYQKWDRLVHPIRFLNLVPLSHVFGQFIGVFVPQLLGGEVVFQDSLNPSEVIESTKRNRVSVIVAVPRMLETLREKIERDYESGGQLNRFRRDIELAEGKHPLKRWWMFRKVHRRFGLKFWAFVSGGATLPNETESFWERMGFAVLQGYGMTETASLISVNHPFSKIRGSIGKTLPGQEMKLDDRGEILVRGANISPGYWDSRSQTAIQNGEWLRTGDIGARDDQGNLFFRGRKKDVIVTAAGLNIYPEDIEAALVAEPEIRDASVIGIEGTNGPEPVAIIIPDKQDSDIDRAVKLANERLSQYQQVRQWFLWPDSDFPRTPTQKVIKRKLAEAIKSGTQDKQSFHGQTIVLADLVARVSGGRQIDLSPSANLTTDLKLDSLGRVELLSAIEDRYQIELDESVFTAATTIADIEKAIRQGKSEDRTYYPYPKWALRFPATLIRRIALYTLLLPFTALLGWPSVRGKRNLRGLKGPVLFISNHVTFIDQSLIIFALPMRFRHRLAIAMEGERLRAFVCPTADTGWFKRAYDRVQYAVVVTFFNVFSLPRRSGFRRSFAYAGDVMDRGYNLLVFPEGERTEHGEMNPFRGGIGILAKELDATIIPIKLRGVFELKKQRRSSALPGQVSVKFGEPVHYDQRVDPAHITLDLERRVLSL